MRLKILILSISVGVAFSFIAVYAVITYDSWQIERTKRLEEVKAILSVHGEPHISVERGLDMGVVYEISSTQLEGKPYDPNSKCLHLKVRTGYFGFPEDISTGSVRYEFGDKRIMEFLEWGGGCISTPVEDVPQSAALIASSELEEVKAFLHKYPSAGHVASRLTHDEVAFEVSYGISKSIVTGEEWDKPGVPESGAALLMQIDRHLNLESIWFWCFVNVGETADVYEIYEDIVAYVEKKQHCWDDDTLTPQDTPPGWPNREDGTKYR